ncbi:MAG TPA: ribonuclease HI family protein [Verrucomicrobiae bacterium]|nr:ribonuclease HI family protein [Verrucomicrobiae bacterium]
MSKYIIYTDGGARGNPGPAAIGVVVYNDKNEVVNKFGEYIGITTNNQAEYQALIRGLTNVLELNGQIVSCFLDSELVVKQLHGKYKVREPGLQPLVTEIFKLTKNFADVEFTHVPREKNKLADKLVNDALDKAGY